MTKENDVVRQKTLADIKQLNLDIHFAERKNKKERLNQLHAKKHKILIQLAIYDKAMGYDK